MKVKGYRIEGGGGLNLDYEVIYMIITPPSLIFSWIAIFSCGYWVIITSAQGRIPKDLCDHQRKKKHPHNDESSVIVTVLLYSTKTWDLLGQNYSKQQDFDIKNI